MILLKFRPKLFAIIYFIFMIYFVISPVKVLAIESGLMANLSQKLNEIYSIFKRDNDFKYHLPENNDKSLTVSWSGYYSITAYNSEVAQCDASPCITANGFNLCDHGEEDSVAVNFLRFGTKVRIPEIFGDRVFVVRDRMHERYQNKLDVWMLSKEEAKQFGVKVAKVEILEYENE